jgi:hypothetical protein
LAARARPYAARTRLFGFIATPNGALCAPPIAASLILLTIFCGQNYVRVRQYALTFFVFSFLKIVF